MLCVQFSQPVNASEPVGRAMVEDAEMYPPEGCTSLHTSSHGYFHPVDILNVNIACRITTTVCIQALIAGPLFACDAQQLVAFPM